MNPADILPMLGLSAAFLLWMSIPNDDDDEPPHTGASPVTH